MKSHEFIKLKENIQNPVAEDGSAEISSWGISPGEWGQFEELAEQVLSAVDSDEAWEAFWTKNVNKLNRLDDPVQDALDNGLASGNLDKLMGYILNGLRAGYRQSGTEPRAALDALTNILENSLRGLSETSTVDGQVQDPKSQTWKLTSLSAEAARAKYGSRRVRVRSGGLRTGGDMVEVLVSLG